MSSDAWRRRTSAYSLYTLLLLLVSLASPKFAVSINTTIHSTHAHVSLAPGFCCARYRCGYKYDAWVMTTYRASDGRLHAFHQAQSAGNDLNSQSGIRCMAFSFQGSAVYIYMAPLSRLNHPPGRQEVCLDDSCQTIDVMSRYALVGNADDPVLMWWANELVPHTLHSIELRLMDNGGGINTRSMSFQYLQYTNDLPAETPRHSLQNGTRLVDVTLHDTNYLVNYSPETDHARCCGNYNPWDKHIFMTGSRAGDSFHHTSNWGSDPRGDSIRQVSFEFKGTALRIFGASPMALRDLWGDGLVHGHQEICIDNRPCQGLQVHQTYLEAQDRSQPVLIWSDDSFSPDAYTSVRLRLLDPDSPVRGTHMTFDRAIVTEVRPVSPWIHPLPDGQYSVHTVELDAITYGPEPQPWSRFSVQSKPYIRASDRTMPNWRYRFRGHDIKVYGAPRQFMQGIPHATQKICIDRRCQFVDVEQVYLAVEMWDYDQPVLLWHVTDLDPFASHVISAVAVRKRGDNSAPRTMTLAYLQYTRFEEFGPSAWDFIGQVLQVILFVVVAIVGIILGSLILAMSLMFVGALLRVGIGLCERAPLAPTQPLLRDTYQSYTRGPPPNINPRGAPPSYASLGALAGGTALYTGHVCEDDDRTPGSLWTTAATPPRDLPRTNLPTSSVPCITPGDRCPH